MDIASTLDRLLPAAQYFGSLTANTKAAYDALDWEDVRPKPSWSDLQMGQIDISRDVKLKEMTAACAAAIVAGFSSSALGAVHSYPSAVNDQINLMGSVTASLLPDTEGSWLTPFWCADAAGVWAYRLHTAAQIQKAGSDGKEHVVACQGNLVAVSEAAASATTLAAIDAITWPSTT